MQATMGEYTWYYWADATCKGESGGTGFPAFPDDPPPTWPRGDGGGGQPAARPKPTAKLPDMRPRTYYRFFVNTPRNAEAVCLTPAQFQELTRLGKPVGSPVRLSDGRYAQTTSYYGTTYANTFGTATVYLNGQHQPTGFHDVYDFDMHSRSSVKAQVLTVIGATGYIFGARDFSVDFNNASCQ